MKLHTIGIVVATALLTATTAFAGQPNPQAQRENALLSKNAGQAVAAERMQRRLTDFAMAPVKNEATLRHLLSKSDKALDPLNAMSPSAKERFIASLVFNENGLVGYNYADLQSELTASQIYKVLSIFGAQSTTHLIKGARILNEEDAAAMQGPVVQGLRMDDHTDYRCAYRATCSLSYHDICMSGC